MRAVKEPPRFRRRSDEEAVLEAWLVILTYTRRLLWSFAGRGSTFAKIGKERAFHGAKEQRAAENGDPPILAKERLGVPGPGFRESDLFAPDPRWTLKDAAQDRGDREVLGREGGRRIEAGGGGRSSRRTRQARARDDGRCLYLRAPLHREPGHLFRHCSRNARRRWPRRNLRTVKQRLKKTAGR